MFLELQIVLDDAVVDNGDTAVFADMGMGVDIIGFPVGCPAGVADAKISLQIRTAVDQITEDLQPSLGLFDLQSLGFGPYCHTGRVIPPVFHPRKPVEQNGSCRLPAYKTDDSTHKNILLIVDGLVIKRTNAQSFVSFFAVMTVLFCGYPHICGPCVAPACTEGHPPNIRSQGWIPRLFPSPRHPAGFRQALALLMGRSP